VAGIASNYGGVSASLPDRDWETPELRWTRATAEGITTETLEVRAPAVPAAVWSTLSTLRKQGREADTPP
jgi:hypothetical protein